MCSYITQIASIIGKGSGPNGWFNINQANVYFDHPFHAPLDHAITIDFVNPAMGPSARVAIELSADSAEELMHTIDTNIYGNGSGDYKPADKSDAVELFGSGKGSRGWFSLEKALIYQSNDETKQGAGLNIDFLSKSSSSGNDRDISVEVTSESAKAISTSINAALENGRREHIL
jgi:hypothetical protein